VWFNIIIMLLISKQYSLITDQDMLQEVCAVLQTWNADRQFASTWWHQKRAANDRVLQEWGTYISNNYNYIPGRFCVN